MAKYLAKFMSAEDVYKLEHEFVLGINLLETADNEKLMKQMLMYIAGANHFAQLLIEHIEEGDKDA